VYVAGSMAPLGHALGEMRAGEIFYINKIKKFALRLRLQAGFILSVGQKVFFIFFVFVWGPNVGA
jgi:hypothetical protein